MSEKRKNPVKIVSLMMIITLVGKVLGLLRDRLLTINYGSGMEASAFLTASRIPRVFFDTVFASAISACLIPVFSEYLQKKGKKDAFKFAGNFITVMAVLCAVLTVLGMLFSSQLTSFFADGYDQETAKLCGSLTKIMMPTVFFTGIAFSFVGVLQSLDEFNVPAAISLVSNCAVIFYYLTLNDRYGIYGLAAAFLVAWLLQAVVQIPSLIKKGFKFTPSLSLRSDGMRQVFKLMLPVMVSTWVLPINQTINSKFGSRLFDGAGVTAIELAYNLYTVIAGVFVLSVTNYVFPRFSKENASGDGNALKKTVRDTIHTTMLIVLPMTAGMAVMARPIVDFIYGGGAFDAFSVDITSRALMVMSLGMIGYAVQSVLSRVYFAAKDGKTPLIAGAVSIISNILICWLLTDRLDVAGIAAASSISFTVNGILLLVPLRRRKLNFADRGFLLDMAKIAAATIVMAAGAYITWRWLNGFAGKLTTLVVPILAGFILYFTMAFILRLPELKLAADFAKKKLGKE